MKTLFFKTALLGTVVLLGSVAVSFAASQLPVAHHDFGQVTTDEIVVHDYVIQNSSEHAWIISDIEPSCDCVQVAAYASRVKAKSSAFFTVVLEPETIGKMHFDIKVNYANARKDKEYVDVYRLSGEVLLPDDLLGEHRPQVTVADLVSAEVLLTEFASSPDSKGVNIVRPQIFDLRGKQAYHRSHISGSVCVTPFELKYAPQWKEHKVVLFDGGIVSKNTVPLLKFLREKGWKNVRILEHGIQRWKLLGGNVNEQSASLVQTSWVTPRVARELAMRQDWKVALLGSSHSELDQIFPNNVSLGRNQETVSLRRALGLQSQSDRTAAYKVLVVSSKGEGYESFAQKTGSLKTIEFYFLEGGIESMVRHLTSAQPTQPPETIQLSNLTLGQDATGHLVNGNRGCHTCPK